METASYNINDETLHYWFFKGPKNGPILHWAHANGFNGPTYYNLLSELSNFCNIYAWDARSHGMNLNLRKPASGRIFAQCTSDLIQFTNYLYEKHKKRIILAGHSFGATLCIKAENSLRDEVSKILLADPVLFTRFHAAASNLLRAFKFKHPKELYLAEYAAKRRNKWQNTAQAVANLSEKSLFKNWDKLSLQNYVTYGTNSIDGHIKLNCSPNIEAQIFKESEREFLSKQIINLSTETHLFLAAKGSPAFAKNSFKKSARTLSQSIIEDSNHSFPIEKYREFGKVMLEKILL